MERNYDSVASINPVKTNWNILVRIVRMWLLPTSANAKKKEPSLDMILCDKDNSLIGASVKGTFYDKFKNILKEGNVFLISQFTVGINGYAFRSTNHEFRVIFQFSTRVTRRDYRTNIPMYGFNFMKLSMVTSTDFEMNHLFDVMGIVTGMSGVTEDISGEVSKTRVSMDIEDKSKSKASVTLWGRYAEQIKDYLSTYKEGPIIIAIQWCRVKEYKGQMVLTNSMYATRVLINADTDEFKDFRESLVGADQFSPSQFKVGTPSSSNDKDNPNNDPFSGVPGGFISDLFIAEHQSVCRVVASVMYVNSQREWFYASCRRCNCKVDPDGNMYYCSRCRMQVPVAVYRYKIELVVSDETGSATLTVFDKDVVKFLGVTVAELRKIHSDECNTEDSQASLPVMFDTFLNKRFVFNVTVKVSDKGYAPSFTVSRMSCDDALVKKWDNDNQQGDYSNPIQIGEEDTSLCTPENARICPMKECEGQALSFTDITTSPEGGSTSCSKVFSADEDPGHGSVDITISSCEYSSGRSKRGGNDVSDDSCHVDSQQFNSIGDPYGKRIKLEH